MANLPWRPVIKSTFHQHVDQLRSDVNQVLFDLDIPEQPKYLYDPVRYVTKGEGKRLRPILVMLTGAEFAADETDTLHAGLAVELLHNFTLVHDDIMDADTLRHGQETVHIHWDESTAILAGDGIYALAQLIMSRVKTNPLAAVRAFNKATLIVCEGQAYDKEFENKSGITLNDYILMIEKKTGWLIGLCAELGGILGNQEPSVLACLRSFGLNLGIAFQIQDDILEIVSDAGIMGKSLGSDVEAGKQTVLTIMARDLFPSEWDRLWLDWKSLPVVDRVRKMNSFIKERDILTTAENLARDYIDKAYQELDRIAAGSRNLYDFTEMVLKRKK
ncbi:MAG: polyprenyl synthetase family protein [Fidelibacterota bacterium]